MLLYAAAQSAGIILATLFSITDDADIVSDWITPAVLQVWQLPLQRLLAVCCSPLRKGPRFTALPFSGAASCPHV